MPKSQFKYHLKSTFNTNERTNGLTKKVVHFRGDMTLSHAREKGTDLTHSDFTNPVHVLPWADEALCAQSDPELWFDHADHWRHRDGQRESLAKTICGRCPVQAACRAYALSDPTLEGIWGGLTQRERMRARRAS